jgi:hypothetical protein
MVTSEPIHALSSKVMGAGSGDSSGDPSLDITGAVHPKEKPVVANARFAGEISGTSSSAFTKHGGARGDKVLVTHPMTDH